KTWQPYKSIEDGGQIYDTGRKSDLTVMNELQAKLKEAVKIGDAESTASLTKTIIDKQRDLTLKDQSFIIESLTDLNEQREKNAIETRQALYDFMKNN